MTRRRSQDALMWLTCVASIFFCVAVASDENSSSQLWPAAGSALARLAASHPAHATEGNSNRVLSDLSAKYRGKRPPIRLGGQGQKNFSNCPAVLATSVKATGLLPVDWFRATYNVSCDQAVRLAGIPRLVHPLLLPRAERRLSHGTLHMRAPSCRVLHCLLHVCAIPDDLVLPKQASPVHCRLGPGSHYLHYLRVL